MILLKKASVFARAQKPSSLKFHRCQHRFYQSGRGVYGHLPNLSGFIDGTAVDLNENEAILRIQEKNRNDAGNIFRLVENYRTHGHRIAKLNPLFPEVDKR